VISQSKNRLLLPGERDAIPVRGKAILWIFLIAFLFGFVIFGARIEVQEVNAQTVSTVGSGESRMLRQREVKAFESIASSLKLIAREIDRW